MSDLSITAANVVKGTNAITETGTAGETITAGQALYKSSTTNKWMKADADGASAEIRTATAIALTGSALNQPIVVQKSGQVTIGATLTPGLEYFLSNTAGGLCLVADIGAGEYVCLIGAAVSASVLDLNFKYTGVANYPMQAGDLRERIGFYRRVDIYDGAGNVQGGYAETPFIVVRANVRAKLGGESIQAGRLAGTNYVNITIRQSENARQITPDWLAKDEIRDVIYNIRSIIDPDQKRRFLELLCEVDVAT